MKLNGLLKLAQTDPSYGLDPWGLGAPGDSLMRASRSAEMPRIDTESHREGMNPSYSEAVKDTLADPFWDSIRNDGWISAFGGAGPKTIKDVYAADAALHGDITSGDAVVPLGNGMFALRFNHGAGKDPEYMVNPRTTNVVFSASTPTSEEAISNAEQQARDAFYRTTDALFGPYGEFEKNKLLADRPVTHGVHLVDQMYKDVGNMMQDEGVQFSPELRELMMGKAK